MFLENKRIVIIGCGGSGKSTLAKQLGKITGIPVIHLDQLFWRQGWTHVSREEFDTLLQNELVKETWIIDGDYDRTIEERLNYCDMVIYLDVPRFVCLYSVIKRMILNLGRTRSDMGAGCPEKIDWEFVEWIWNFNKTHRKKYLELLTNVKDKEIIILHRRSNCKKLLNEFNNSINV